MGSCGVSACKAREDRLGGMFFDPPAMLNGRFLGSLETRGVLEHLVEVDLPSAMMLEHGDVTAEISSGPEAQRPFD